MTSLPRILAVDPTNQIGDIVRGSMMLLDRRFRFVEVPSASDALTELQTSDFDLLITAYHLPDHTGLELAARAIRESAGTAVIVLATAADPVVDSATLANAPYSYFIRPVGEQFLRALRIGLGEAVAAEEVATGGSNALDLGPIPDVDMKMLRDQTFSILRETVAMGAFVADRHGRVIHSEGVTGYFDINACAAVLAPHFASTVMMRDFTAGNAWSMQYFDGDEYDIVAMSLGLHYFVGLIYDGSKRMNFGAVFSGRKATESIADGIGADAWTFRRQVATRTTQTMLAPKIETGNLPAIAEFDRSPDNQPTEPFVVAALPELKLEPVKNLDVDKLLNQKVDEEAFDDLFSDDDFNQVSNLLGETSLSFDEAMNMGILDQ
jgi:CheY-like chemotaxis protein